MTGCWLIYTPHPVAVDPREVARVLRDMQRVLPLGALSGFEILCLDSTVLSTDHPGNGRADAITLPGYIALSADLSVSLWDLLTHEVSHALAARLIDAGELAQLKAILGDAYGEEGSEWWSTMPGERLAEYMSAALWGSPVTERMPQLSTELLWRVKQWALASLEKHPPVEVVTDPSKTIKLTIGSTTAYVNGSPVTLDAAPIIVNGRTLVPIRFVAENLDCRVGWDQETWTVEIQQ